MEKQDIIARLKENEAALKARGVVHAALFGSRARGDARPDSDIDILIDVCPASSGPLHAAGAAADLGDDPSCHGIDLLVR